MSPSVWDLFAKRGSPACYSVTFDEIQGGHLVTPDYKSRGSRGQFIVEQHPVTLDYKSGGSRGQFVKVFSLI
jgi:hypothetical protein